MKRTLLAIFLSAVMFVSTLAVFPVSAAEPELDWDLLDLDFSEAADFNKIAVTAGDSSKVTLADGYVHATKGSADFHAKIPLASAVSTGKLIVEAKFRTNAKNVNPLRITEGTVAKVHAGVNGTGLYYLKGSANVVLENAIDEQWHVVTYTVDFDAKTVYASIDGGTAVGGAFGTYAQAATFTADTVMFAIPTAAVATGDPYVDLDYVRASTGATVSSGGEGGSGSEGGSTTTPATAPIGKYKGTYVNNKFDASTNITLGTGATVADGVLTVPAANPAAETKIEFDDIMLTGNTLYVSYAVKASADMNFSAHIILNTNAGPIYAQVSKGNASLWATGDGAAKLGAVNDGEWHTIDVKYTFGENWEISASLDGTAVVVLNPTVVNASTTLSEGVKDQLAKMKTVTTVQSFSIKANTDGANGSVTVDNLAIGDGTLVKVNGDTSDMTVSVAVASVAVIAAVAVISKKRRDR